jgi:hypothetical protein
MITTKPLKSIYAQWKEGTYQPTGFTRDLIQLFEKAHHHDQKRLRMAYPSVFGLDEYEAIATIYCAGDRSVGISDFSYTMTLHRDLISSPKDREEWRKHIAAMYVDILDGFRPVVSFDDEHEEHDEA